MQIAPKRLKLWTSYLSSMFSGTAEHEPLHDPLFFGKGSICKNSLGRDMHSHKRLLVLAVLCVMIFFVYVVILQLLGSLFTVVCCHECDECFQSYLFKLDVINI